MGVSGTVLIVGATPVVAGTSGRVLYDNAGALGELTTTGSGTVLVLQTAPTLTGPVIVNEAVGSSGLTLTGATQVTSFPVLSATQTWNAVGTVFTGIKLNITNTASATASNLLDLQIGSVSKFQVLTAAASSAVRTYGIVFGSTTNDFVKFGFHVGSHPIIDFNTNAGGLKLRFDGDTTGSGGPGVVSLSSDSSLAWTNNTNGGTADTFLVRDAANTLALRNTTSAQKFKVYNTFTTIDTAGEWFAIDWITTANVCNLQAVKGSSSGTARVLNISYGGTQASPVAAISIPITSGDITLGGGLTSPNSFLIENATAIPANGSTGKGYKFSSTSNFGVFFGSSTPSLSAAKGSLYLRSDGSGATDRAYINTDGGTTWTALTTVG